jgi:hypothetical protein
MLTKQHVTDSVRPGYLAVDVRRELGEKTNERVKGKRRDLEEVGLNNSSVILIQLKTIQYPRQENE